MKKELRQTLKKGWNKGAIIKRSFEFGIFMGGFERMESVKGLKFVETSFYGSHKNSESIELPNRKYLRIKKVGIFGA
jgi:hypothetical protein